MSDINNISGGILSELGVSAQQQDKEKSEELGQDAFLQLMIAQLQNQDPLSPQENGEFIAQLAQFSSVEGITNLGASVNNLVNEFRSSRALEASALVGKSVEVGSNQAPLVQGSNLNGTIVLPASTEQLQITVTTPLGEVVRVEQLGAQPAGELAFAWDGRNSAGEAMPPGNYRVNANAFLDGESTEVPVRLAANVNSVSLGSNGAITLNVDGIGEIDIDDVRKFL
ncbi:MAG: flagellar hook assembly protein FlgD [Gammaproteobacteria bacterium]|nr:flagellar hook assembly protein FlgD [Gammaproteobacteria bacterium]NND39048.1 flagellar hook assembly protein FlgD [Pseudomonadales bacterium]NNL10967.1 flagellar hook assembly protein FlgD [Pseudomonadales bacterium]NNM12137.1 flagellar hook assembly protein FlgD [Pseudomonadales bacterium]RZV49391.1 MAG: flagellar hook assembly protein FlgD [Pseudomonadales bacterium]